MLRSTMLLVLLALGACGASAANVELRTPARTVDDRVELSLDCTRPKRVARCATCPIEVKRISAPCPARALTMRAGDGTVVETTIPVDGDVSADVAGPVEPDRAWQVEVDGLPLGTTRRRTYRWLTTALDGLVVLSAVAVLAVNRDHVEDAEVPWIVASAGVVYALGTPIAHAAHGNGEQAWRSLGRRMIAPAIGSLLALNRNCFDNCSDRGWRLTALITYATAPLLMLWDYHRAEVTTGLPLVTPTVTVDGEHAVLGLGGSF